LRLNGFGSSAAETAAARAAGEMDFASAENEPLAYHHLALMAISVRTTGFERGLLAEMAKRATASFTKR
jgi:hypothetical protein